MEEIASRHGFLKILLLLTVVSIKHVQCDIGQYERTLVVYVKLYYFHNPGLTLKGDPMPTRNNLIFTLYFSGSQRGDLEIFENAVPLAYATPDIYFFQFRTEPKSVYNREFRIQSNWTDGFTIEVDVQDLSTEGHLVPYDNFKKVLQEPSNGFHEPLESPHPHRKHSSLVVIYNVTTRCDRSVFYGKLCQVYCKPEDSDNGHYTCNTEGMKTCLPGWLDPDDDCKRPNECYRGYCQNNGNCSALESKTYLCTCPKNYTGDQCEIPMVVDCTEDDKRMANCTNGGMCVIDKGNRICNCSTGYSGSRCEEPLDRCKHYEPCKNGGSCKNVHRGYVCQCPVGMAGKDCENVCGRDVQCGNSGHGGENTDSWVLTRLSEEEDNHGIELLPGTAAVFLGVAAAAMASCLGL